MGSTRRSFTEEYKAEAVRFVLEGGRSVAEVSRNIGCHETTLGIWVKKARDEDREPVDPQAPLDESERLELIRLRGAVKDKDAELAELRTQVEFAKKVATWVCPERLRPAV
jgi:transposase